jgi:hypothetical protein
MSQPGSNDLSCSIRVNPHYQQQGYDPKYCTLGEFESDFLTYEVSEDTVPSVDGAIRALQGAEAEVDSKEWGRYTQTNEILNGNYDMLSFQWWAMGMFTQVFQTNHNNILHVISLMFNNGGSPSGAPIWQEVKEGPGSNTHFMINKSTRLKEQVGSAIIVYSNMPYPGPGRIRVTYEYGMNIDRALLREYVGKRAAINVLEQRAAAENINLNLDKGPWSALYKKYAARLVEMRDQMFPKKVRKVYIYPAMG